MASAPRPASDSAVRDGGSGGIEGAHTQGAWTVVFDKDDESYEVIYHKPDYTVIIAYGLTKKNADLVGAAPAMLAALKAVVTADKQQPFSFPTMPCIKQAIAAIAVAEGKLPAPTPVAHGTETCAVEAGKPV